MSRAIEDRIGALAAGQHGVVTYRQLLGAGLSPSGLDRRRWSGRLRALHRGVYLALPFPLPRTREMAAVLASGAGAVLSHLSAAEDWELRPKLMTAADLVDVGVRTHGKRRAGIRMHRMEDLGVDERRVLGGIPLTSPGRTLVDVAAVLGVRELEAAVARAEREHLVTSEELANLPIRYEGHRGMRALRTVLGAPGGAALTRSAAEERFLALVREARLPAPQVNVRAGPYEIDFLWRSAGLAVEVDGFRYHAARSRFEGDRRKDAYLLAGGIAVLRLTWRQITGEPLAVVAQLAPALARAERDRR